MIRTEHKESKWKFPFIKYENRFSAGKIPLIVLLHGAGERGDGSDLSNMEHAFTERFRNDTTHECMIVMPRCPWDTFWVAKVESILDFIEQIKSEFNVDEKRIYLTGLSMGGFGTWFTAMAKPELFAAIVPICGGGMEWNANVLTMPVQTFHGVDDDVVPVCHTDNMVAKMKSLGLDVTYTRIPNAGHEIWNDIYTPELLEWMLSKHKGD